MKKSRTNGGAVQFLFSILLFFALGLCGVFSIIIGAQVYENISLRSNEIFEECTVLSYITNKVRQGDAAGMVEVKTVEEQNVLRLSQIIEGSEYETLIYYLDDRVMEMFTSVGSGLELKEGVDIMDARPIAFSMADDSLLKAGLADGTSQIFMSLRSEKEEGGEDSGQE